MCYNVLTGLAGVYEAFDFVSMNPASTSLSPGRPRAPPPVDCVPSPVPELLGQVSSGGLVRA